MALLSACWLTIESIVIQDGFLRWSYMKSYMHPVVLFLWQLLIWLYLFFLWLLPPFQALYNAILSVLVMFSKLFSSFLRVIIMFSREVTCDLESRKEIKNTPENNSELSRRIHNPVPAFSFSFQHQVDSQLKAFIALQKGKILEEEEDDDFFYEFDQEELFDTKEGEEEEDINIDIDIDIVDDVNMEKNLDFEIHTIPIDQEDESSLASDDDEEEEEDIDVESDISSLVASDRDHPSPLSVSSLDDSALQDPPVIGNQTRRVEDDETDQVYKIYCERMRWYDILSRDRTYGLRVISNQVTASSLSSWGKTTEKKLNQSIENDLERVYVAQSCLSWEALQHQYIIVRDNLKPADSQGRFYDDDISREFQNFQILLDRCMEDERCEGKRILSFAQRRIEFMSFFQVPRLSGSYNREGPHEGEKERKDKQVLKAIEKCIEVFWDFVQVDIKKPLVWERLKNSFVNFPRMELEDPKDFKLYLHLRNLLQKKGQLLKEMQGNKKKIWFKKKSSSKMEENEIEKDEKFMLVRFIMIDLKLVSRVLHMSLVSSSHLNWCQHKLNNIHFDGDNISRTSSSVLFPS